jgi:7-keto-8-aminopelargonate synthetase-like enzyme
MAYSTKAQEFYTATLDETREAGLYKDERFIHSAQGADIEVEFPEGAAVQQVINLCANNYLGLSSHPDVIKAAHEGLDARGYGMSSVRFICGTQDIHRELRTGSCTLRSLTASGSAARSTTATSTRT